MQPYCNSALSRTSTIMSIAYVSGEYEDTALPGLQQQWRKVPVTVEKELRVSFSSALDFWTILYTEWMVKKNALGQV